MSRINFALSALILTLGHFSTQAQTPQPDYGTADVSGVVTLKGEPSCGVIVEMVDQREARDRFKWRFAKTDVNGRFHFYRVAARKYWITASAPGHTSPGNDGMGTSGQSLDVAEGAKIENITLEIKRGGVITGRVTDSRGAPAADEELHVHRLNKDGNLYANALGTRTDDRGVYRFYGLSEGRYLVSVGDLEDFQGLQLPPRAFYPNVTSKSEAKVVEAALESETKGIDITLPDPKHFSIKGEQTGEIPFRLVTEDEVGLPNVKVFITRVDRDGRSLSKSSGSAAGATDENGNFKIPDFGPIDGPDFYSVRVLNAKGYAPKHPVYQRAGDVVMVTMVKGGVITGRITNAMGYPVIGASLIVELTRDAGGKPMPEPMWEKIRYIATDDRGVYRLSGLTPGSYVVQLSNRSSACPSANNEIVPIYYPSSTREKAAEVTVLSGVVTSDIDIRYRENQGHIK